ncbi:chemotaxis methyltransferase CheR [Enterobacter cancerogenus]|uniref:Chemotaxis methyltransferase CheR n=1 Tax=Enterobacter cancerogenus TaxID=69218 RepID=A0A484Y3D2_9ENTR|nr:chemotaxis methyltransferase CheR [Enterobacter cancerogenus]
MTSPMPSGQTSLLQQMTQRLALSDAHFRRICQLIYQRAGIVLADHKRDMVYNRLVRRLRTLGLDDFGRYLSMLEANQNSAEWQAFINSLTTNLTAFFREAHHFPVLAEHARRRTGEYRVWSAAASNRRGAVFAGDHPGRYAWHGAGALESVRQRHRHRGAGKSAQRRLSPGRTENPVTAAVTALLHARYRPARRAGARSSGAGELR